MFFNSSKLLILIKYECPIVWSLSNKASTLLLIIVNSNSKLIPLKLKCLKCGKIYRAEEIDFANIPPRCENDDKILKPDFIFFGEGIPPNAYSNSFAEAEKSEVCIIIGSTGEVMPASILIQWTETPPIYSFY